MASKNMCEEVPAMAKDPAELSTRLYVGGLFCEVTDADLIGRFEKFGQVSSVDIVRRTDDKGKPERTFAYVNLTTTDQKLKKCMAVYNKSKWKGHDMQIQVAKESFLARLAKEREATKMELSTKKLSPERPEPSPPRQWTVQGAVPGTEVEGERNWVVGKYGRILPVVYIRRKDKKKVMKVNPSKYSHNLKKMKEEHFIDPPISQLTWDIQVQGTEESRKKRQGDFSDFMKGRWKRSGATLQAKNKKMKIDVGNKSEEHFPNSNHSDPNTSSHIGQSGDEKDDKGYFAQHEDKTSAVGNTQSRLDDSDNDSDSKELSNTTAIDKDHDDDDSDFEVVSLEQHDRHMTGVLDGNMLLGFKSLVHNKQGGVKGEDDSDRSVDTDELLTATKHQLVQHTSMEETFHSGTDSEMAVSSRKKLQGTITTQDVNRNSSSKQDSTDDESEDSDDAEMIAAARLKLQVIMSSPTVKNEKQGEKDVGLNVPVTTEHKATEQVPMDETRRRKDSSNGIWMSQEQVDSDTSYNSPQQQSDDSSSSEDTLNIPVKTSGKGEHFQKTDKRNITERPLESSKSGDDGDDIDDEDEEDEDDDSDDSNNIDDEEEEEDFDGGADSDDIDDEDVDGNDIDDDYEEEEDVDDIDDGEDEDVDDIDDVDGADDVSGDEDDDEEDDDDDDDHNDELEDDESPDSDSTGESLSESDSVEENESGNESSSEDSSNLEAGRYKEDKIVSPMKPNKSPDGTTPTENQNLLDKTANNGTASGLDMSSTVDIGKGPADRQKLKSSSVGEVKTLANEQRLESLRQRQLQGQSKQALISKALSTTASSTAGKHTVFDSEDEDSKDGTEVREEAWSSTLQHDKAEEKTSQLGLFESDSEEDSDSGSEDSDEQRFQIKPQFEGKTGEKLLELQAQIGQDDRFRMDHRFLEEDSDGEEQDMKKTPTPTEETDGDLEAERQKSLEILRRVVGTKAAMATEKGKNIDKLKFKDPSAMRYDPTREDHKQFEIPDNESQKDVEESGAGTHEEAPPEETVPNITKDKYFQVATDLKEAFSGTGGQTFSFFGPSSAETTEDIEVDMASESTQTAPKKSPWQPKVFQYDSSDDDDDDEMTQDDLKKIPEKEVEEPKKRNSFFFAENHSRLKEGILQFYRTDKLEDIRQAWEEVRPELLEESKKRHKNAVRQRKKNQKNKPRHRYK